MISKEIYVKLWQAKDGRYEDDPDKACRNH